jgi:hypothetical protein
MHLFVGSGSRFLCDDGLFDAQNTCDTCVFRLGEPLICDDGLLDMQRNVMMHVFIVWLA